MKVPAFLVQKEMKVLQKMHYDNVNPAHGYIFVHIPKNAGSSINKVLGIEGSHCTAQQYRKYLGWKYRLFFSFCFVRNPWSRFVSSYNYARLEESLYHSALHPEKAKWGKHLDYDILKNASLNTCAHLLLEGKLRHDSNWNHWHPQSDWICDAKGKVMVDFVGRVESINKDFEFIARKTGLTGTVPKVNASGESNNYRHLYDDETKEIVSRYYAADIERFGYTF